MTTRSVPDRPTTLPTPPAASPAPAGPPPASAAPPGATGAAWAAMLPLSAHGDPARRAMGASGVRVRFADGVERLDGVSGLWNVNLGYGNEAIADAVAETLREASYLSLYQQENDHAHRAARALLDVCGPDHYGRVLFATSGGSANDLVMKLARQYQTLRGEPRRNGVLALDGCWHGLTLGAFALTSDALGQRMYGVDRRLVLHTPPNDVAELERTLARHGDRIAAVVVEPVQGTGTVPLSADFVEALTQLRRAHGFLLVADEVATGFGRTGRFFASAGWPAPPDVLISSKGLTNGTMAAAAVVVSHEVAATFERAGATLAHGETQAGTPVTCAAVLATLAEARRLDAVARAARLADRLDRELALLRAAEPTVVGSRGTGCMRTVLVRRPDGGPLPEDGPGRLADAVRAAGALVHVAPDGVALLPALVYTEEDLTELFATLRRGLAAHARQPA